MRPKPPYDDHVFGWIRRHRGISIALGLVGLVLGIFVLVWFQPQKLFLDQRVDEDAPAVAATTPSPGATPDDVGGDRPASILARGEFRSLEHTTTGQVLLIELGDGSRVLRFEDLSTSNGPDLHVYLSVLPAGDDWYVYDDEEFVDLGKLKGNIGSQNYEIPDDVDVTRFRSAVVWCERFSVGFGVAPLA